MIVLGSMLAATPISALTEHCGRGAGGLMSAIIGPQLVNLTTGEMPAMFMGPYLVVMGINGLL